MVLRVSYCFICLFRYVRSGDCTIVVHAVPGTHHNSAISARVPVFVGESAVVARIRTPWRAFAKRTFVPEAVILRAFEASPTPEWP